MEPKYCCTYCDNKYESYADDPRCPKCLDSHPKVIRRVESTNVFGYPEDEKDTYLDYDNAYLQGD